MKKVISAVLAVVLVLSMLSMSASALGKQETGATDEWKAMVKENYDEFIAEVDGDSSKIPFIVSTDQHGQIRFGTGYYSYINEIVDWSKISKIINLGDTVETFYNHYELLAYRSETKCLPSEKRIEICGNHDGHIIPAIIGTRLFFNTPNAERSLGGGAFVVKDEQFNVRYLALDPMGLIWTYKTGRLTTNQANFLIKELSKDDSSDIVLLSHPYLFNDAIIKRDGTTFTGSETFISKSITGTDVKQSFLDMLLARKNKTAGVLVDSFGIKHSYDFSNCESDFLMTLHGHHHGEGYETKNGITEFLFRSFSYDSSVNPNLYSFYFAYIDTEAKTFKCWDNVKGDNAWEISIA